MPRSFRMLALALGSLSACKPAPVPPATEVRALSVAALPSAPDDVAWRSSTPFLAPLLMQDMVEPRLMAPSTPQVEVRALTDGTRVAFRLAWDDATKDDLPQAARFADACAVQMPAKAEADVPAQMGEAGRLVEIAYWSAFFQATVDGRPDDIHALYPNAKVDTYPFQAAAIAPGSPEQQAMALRYAPARAMANPMSGPRTTPVQDLLAEGPGTLRPAAGQVSSGKGVFAGKGWAVEIARPLPSGLAPGARSQVAFAVWQGASQEVGARKMRTAWIPMLVGAKP